MEHTCHATACETPVPQKLWGCPKHWFMVPYDLRQKIYRTYREGQCDDLNPSAEYLLYARLAVVAVATKEGIEPDTRLYDAFLERKDRDNGNQSQPK